MGNCLVTVKKLGLRIPEHFAGETNTSLTFTNCPYNLEDKKPQT